MRRLKEIRYPLPIFGLCESSTCSELQVQTSVFILYSDNEPKNIFIPLADFNIMRENFPNSYRKRFRMFYREVKQKVETY